VTETWPEQRARHRLEQYTLTRDALERAGWSVGRAARLLGTAPATLRRVVDRHPDLTQRVAQAAHGPGRPKSA
jgi:transcriptional regulator with GAF, ATPase, and Fis domain